MFALYPAIIMGMVLLEPKAIFAQESVNGTICYGRLGCYDEGIISFLRPFNKPPAKFKDLSTTFYLYTPANLNGEIIHDDDYEVIDFRHYNPLQQTKVIIHGFMDKGSAEWITQMRMAFINKGKNVIIVDWASGAGHPYDQAVSNSRLVGLQLSHILKGIIEKRGGDPQYLHIIGHGIGAHIAGYMSDSIASLGRITGLDPAGYRFTNTPENFRLDPSDAIFVDVIHTDSSLGQGMDQPCGHVDFYPNGGFTQMRRGHFRIPFLMRSSLNPGADAESHKLAVEYFTESIISSPFNVDAVNTIENSCIFVGFLCKSYDEFLKGNCIRCGQDAMDCAMMGIDADRYPGIYENPSEPKKFFLKTNENRPYCGNHYSFQLSVAKTSPSLDEVNGTLSATIAGDDGIAWDVPLTTKEARKMEKGKSYSFMGFSKTNVGRIKSVDMKWNWNTDLEHLMECIRCDKNLFISRLAVINFGYNHFHRFEGSSTCSEESIKIQNGGSALIPLPC